MLQKGCKRGAILLNGEPLKLIDKPCTPDAALEPRFNITMDQDLVT